MATIKVLFIPCDEYGMLEAEIREVENELGALQGLVGGYLETYPFGMTDDGREVLVVCDEEGKLKGKPVSWGLQSEFGLELFVGDTFLVIADNGDFVGSDEDAELLLEAWGRG